MHSNLVLINVCLLDDSGKQLGAVGRYSDLAGMHSDFLKKHLYKYIENYDVFAILLFQSNKQN